MFLHVPTFPLHVEHIDQEFIAVEEEAEAEDQEQQLQELEAVEQVEEQDPVSDFANSDQQPSKHRKHLTQCHIHIFKFQSYIMLFTCALSL